MPAYLMALLLALLSVAAGVYALATLPFWPMGALIGLTGNAFGGYMLGRLVRG